MRLMFSARAIENMAGGVERMITRIMNEMVNRGHQVHLLTLDAKGAQAFYPLTNEIVWHQLDTGNPNQAAGNHTRIIRALKIRNLVSRVRPDVMIGFQDGPFMALSLYTLSLGIPVIAAERNAPTRFNHTNAGWKRKQITFNAFRLARSITVQFDSYKSQYPEYLQNKIVHIPNPVDQTEHQAHPCQSKNGRYELLSVGRLSYQKNYETLITAFSQISDQFPEWDLSILGEGEERGKLEELILKKNLSHRIKMPGKTSDTSVAYTNANLFCLPSLWEGFPNALAEAAAHGLPLIGFSDCCGVNELVKENDTGSLAQGINNSETLSKTLANLMSNPEKRASLGAKARLAMTSYTPNHVMDNWEQLFKDTTHQ
ncbi:MAG: glycosyltransferase family 4 protein [Methyloligellaceae bacterium]